MYPIAQFYGGNFLEPYSSETAVMMSFIAKPQTVSNGGIARIL